jgi:hypothetical protein
MIRLLGCGLLAKRGPNFLIIHYRRYTQAPPIRVAVPRNLLSRGTSVQSTYAANKVVYLVALGLRMIVGYTSDIFFTFP